MKVGVIRDFGFTGDLMNILLVYDVEERKVNKVMKLCRQYLNHIQNSVFEGEIRSSDFKELTLNLKRMINEKTDSVVIYEIWNAKKTVLGVEKRETSNVI